MNSELECKLKRLKQDFAQHSKSKEPFNYFFCPILFWDENVELCKAHIVNQAFPNAPRQWTVQNEDIDSFYGTHFEANFTKLKYFGVDFEEILSNSEIYNKLKPKVSRDGQPIEIYPYNDQHRLPINHSLFSYEGKTGLFGLKVSSTDVDSTKGRNWHIEYEADLTLDAIPTLIKAGYLMLFYVFGYRTVLSATGIEVGRFILGKFFLDNLNNHRDRKKIRDNAKEFFGKYINLVRPVEQLSWDSQGTASDGLFFACRNTNNEIWATIMVVNIGGSIPLHLVVMPIIASEGTANSYHMLLAGKLKRFEVTICSIDEDREAIKMHPNWQYIDWDMKRKMNW